MIFLIPILLALTACSPYGVDKMDSPDGVLYHTIPEEPKEIYIEHPLDSFPTSGIVKLKAECQKFEDCTVQQYMCFSGASLIGKSEAPPYNHIFKLQDIILRRDLPRELRRKGVRVYYVSDTRLHKGCPTSFYKTFP